MVGDVRRQGITGMREDMSGARNAPMLLTRPGQPGSTVDHQPSDAKCSASRCACTHTAAAASTSTTQFLYLEPCATLTRTHGSQ